MITLTNKQCDKLHIYLSAAAKLIESKPLKKGLEEFDKLITENTCQHPNDDQGMVGDMISLNETWEKQEDFERNIELKDPSVLETMADKFFED